MEELFFLRLAVRAKVLELSENHYEVVSALLEQAEAGRDFNYSDIARDLDREPHSIQERAGRAFMTLSELLRDVPEVKEWLSERRLAVEVDAD